MKHFKFHFCGGIITAAVVAEDAEAAWKKLLAYPSIISEQRAWPHLFDRGHWEIVETFEVETLEDGSEIHSSESG